jgi:predicted DNA-binding protein
MKRLTINLSEELHKRLKLHSVLTDQEMTEIIRRLIEEYLDRADKKLKK